MASNHRNKKPLPFLFNPYEMAICGFSGVGKTTLLTRLFEIFSQNHRVGYIKSDAHHFDLDKEKKDTWRMHQAGAHQVYINSANAEGSYQNHTIADNLKAYSFIDNDFVLVEGYKNSTLPKIAFIDQDQLILQQIENKNSIKAYVGEFAQCPIDTHLPYFQRDSILEIANFILSYFNGMTTRTPLYGLLLGGGFSQRMGTDKNHLEINGKTLSQRGLEFLDSICDQTFHSCRPGQTGTPPFIELYDTFLHLGPFGGILSAQQKYPNAAWLVLATDLPRVNAEVLSHLLSQRNPFKMATAFDSDYSKHPEPLCALWEPKSYLRNLQVMARGLGCPRSALIESQVQRVPQLFKGSLDNANTPEEFENIIRSL